VRVKQPYPYGKIPTTKQAAFVGNLTKMAKKTDLFSELNSLRAEVRILKEQVATYTAHPPMPTDHPHIVRIKGVQGGEPIVRDVGVTVRGIVEMTRMGDTPQQIADAYEPYLSLAQVYDALSYYHDHPGEIEEYIRQHEAAGKEAMKLSREFLQRLKRNRKRRAPRSSKGRKNGK